MSDPSGPPSKLLRSSSRIVGVPGKQHRLKIERAKFLVVQARSFILSGEVVALPFCGDQQRRDTRFTRSQNAQFDRPACQPRHVLIAANENAR